jgi:hypothetical protein
MVAADVVLDESDCLVQRPIARPASEPHVLAGTGESFQVHHDRFELRLPLTVNNAAGGEITRGRAVGQEGRGPRAERQSALSEDVRAAEGVGMSVPPCAAHL